MALLKAGFRAHVGRLTPDLRVLGLRFNGARRSTHGPVLSIKKIRFKPQSAPKEHLRKSGRSLSCELDEDRRNRNEEMESGVSNKPLSPDEGSLIDELKSSLAALSYEQKYGYSDVKGKKERFSAHVRVVFPRLIPHLESGPHQTTWSRYSDEFKMYAQLSHFARVKLVCESISFLRNTIPLYVAKSRPSTTAFTLSPATEKSKAKDYTKRDHSDPTSPSRLPWKNVTTLQPEQSFSKSREHEFDQEAKSSRQNYPMSDLKKSNTHLPIQNRVNERPRRSKIDASNSINEYQNMNVEKNNSRAKERSGVNEYHSQTMNVFEERRSNDMDYREENGDPLGVRRGEFLEKNKTMASNLEIWRSENIDREMKEVQVIQPLSDLDYATKKSSPSWPKPKGNPIPSSSKIDPKSPSVSESKFGSRFIFRKDPNYKKIHDTSINGSMHLEFTKCGTEIVNDTEITVKDKEARSLGMIDEGSISSSNLNESSSATESVSNSALQLETSTNVPIDPSFSSLDVSSSSLSSLTSVLLESTSGSQTLNNPKLYLSLDNSELQSDLVSANSASNSSQLPFQVSKFVACGIPQTKPISLASLDMAQDMEQGSEEWHNLRKTRLTASAFAKAIGFWPDDRVNLWKEKIGLMEPFQGNDATRWGVAQEKEAVGLYRKLTGSNVTHMSFQVYKDGDDAHSWLGASPDGLIESDHLNIGRGGGILEVKCPFNKGYPQKANPNSAVHTYYMPQAQGLLEILDREWMDFYVWTVNGSVVFRVYREPEYWELVLRVLSEFWWCNVVPAKHALREGADPASLTRYEPEKLHGLSERVFQESVRLSKKSFAVLHEKKGKVTITFN